uniref:PUA domain-containing protein n=1 Tax=Coccolithus braarudii TaxID=221442 RepID=A0A7S0Q2B3_9EUKA
MFKKFTREEHVKSHSKVKSSEQRGIRSAVLNQYPALEEHIDELMPKKEPLFTCKCQNNVQLVLAPNGEFIFFQCRSGPFIPTLRLLQKYPDILPKYQVDKGAIRFVLAGANIMSPGLTSPGGKMDEVPANSVVGVFAEGKEHPLAIGITEASTEEIHRDNKGIAVENTHYLKDDLWNLRAIE